MTKTILAAITLSIAATGCAVQQPLPTSATGGARIVSMSDSYRPSVTPPENPSLGMCRAISDYATTAARMRQEGYSKKESQTAVAMAAITRGNAHTVEGKMAGTSMFMVIDRVYTNKLTPANAERDVFSWCVRENVPLAVYLANR